MSSAILSSLGGSVGRPAAQPRLVGLDRVAGDDEVLHLLGQARLLLADPAAELADSDLGGAVPAFLFSRSGHSRPRTNAASCMIPSLSGLAIFFSVGDVAARHLVPADLVLRGLLDGAQHGVELGRA